MTPDTCPRCKRDYRGTYGSTGFCPHPWHDRTPVTPPSLTERLDALRDKLCSDCGNRGSEALFGGTAPGEGLALCRDACDVPALLESFADLIPREQVERERKALEAERDWLAQQLHLKGIQGGYAYDPNHCYTAHDWLLRASTAVKLAALSKGADDAK